MERDLVDAEGREEEREEELQYLPSIDELVDMLENAYD